MFNPSYGLFFGKNDQTNPHNRLAGKGGKWWSFKKDTGEGWRPLEALEAERLGANMATHSEDVLAFHFQNWEILGLNSSIKSWQVLKSRVQRWLAEGKMCSLEFHNNSRLYSIIHVSVCLKIAYLRIHWSIIIFPYFYIYIHIFLPLTWLFGGYTLYIFWHDILTQHDTAILFFILGLAP